MDSNYNQTEHAANFKLRETKTELITMTTVHRQQTNHQKFTIIRGNEDCHNCSGNRSLILLLYTTCQFVRKQKENLLINILKHFQRQPPFPYLQLYYVLATDSTEKTLILV